MERAELARLRGRQVLAYTQALLFRRAMGQGRMPDFDKVFPDPARRGQAMSGEAIMAVLQDWTAAINKGQAPKGE